ncbi:VWA domain-containing protein [Desulfoluna butyratoxydans]|uniref:von willebrand factor type a n=1 Tax=Desulfoluna butyratoxydans TaxID=231438 RepID=A0A4U8YP70_9BACT|nr:VWA domain-containing protein [Desulfoluna butyratoxydans]VFQ45474.1 von willebrand factor type a [Desulfoluna butyratoxydans]
MRSRHTWWLVALAFLITSPALADDTAIYGTQPVTLEPNVMIIFDTSGSMSTADVQGQPYDSTTVYGGTYSSDAVYYRRKGSWEVLTNHVDNILCQPIKNTLKTVGYDRDYLKNNLNCGGARKRMRTGNYMNYDSSNLSENRTRMSVAKEVVNELLADITGVRFGLMVFHYSEGGYVVAECGTDNSTISTAVSGLTDGGYTPLAETLAEAGLYFAGQASHFNNGTSYTSPIQHSCQKNYVIIVTDGEPTRDANQILYQNDYYNGKKIGDYNNDGREFNNDGTLSSTSNTDFLDDVAGFLYDTDMHTMGAGTSFEKQNIITHTIGFKLDHDLLSRTAILGGGSYHTANTASSLKEAFVQIISTIVEESTVFVAPVVPVNRVKRTADGGFIYLAFFKPIQIGEWLGNLKKYGLDSVGDILDSTGVAAVNADGTMKDNSLSYWTQLSTDGADVTKGGAGERIQVQTSRNIYTYTGTSNDLTDASNSFVETNTAIGVDAALITEVRNGINDWPIGSIIHSEPTVVHYSTSATMIYFGSNDGLFRCINDANGEEVWAFVPPGQLNRLNLLQDNNNDYYVDGPPGVDYGARITGTDLFTPETVLVGERRGGSTYYALNITDYNAPRWKYDIEETHLGTGAEVLGQSWGTPEVRTIKVSADTTADVFILPGGYDNQQDLDTPASTDSVGRALFAVVASSGALTPVKVHAGNWSSMTHSIVDVAAVDHNADGITTRIYAGDMAGQVFVLADDVAITGTGADQKAEEVAPAGTWSYKNRLFRSGLGKIFYAPVASDIEGSVEVLYFGTGNRADPLDTTESNRFYGVYNYWLDTDLTPANDLLDVSNPNGSYDEALKAKKGWYMNLPNPGEKVVSQALVDSGVVYFTTYTPVVTGIAAPIDDPCGGTGARGTGRLYAVSMLDATPVTDWGNSSSGKVRSTILPADLPIAVPIIKNRKIYVGAKSWDLPENDRVEYFYWKQTR